MIKQPNSAHCFVCGLNNALGLRLSFYELSDTEVTACYTPPDDYEGYPGVLHGGIVAALLDEVGSRAGMIGAPGHFMVTAHLDVKYRRPTPIGRPLTLYGRLVKRSGRRAVAAAELRLPDGGVSASADLMLADLPADTLPPGDLETLGWRVYPDGDTPA
ncbi:MAG: PaaI family thioesterase [Anaerolineales bacterium]|nr:PaaI family thioesterase [Anaerolineales bacterium]